MKVFLRTVVLLLLCTLLAALALPFFGITVSLGFLNPRLESLAADLLDRPVGISDPVRLRLSFQPSLELGGVRVGNPFGWPEGSPPLLSVDRGRAEIGLKELLTGRIRIIDLEFSGVDMNLITRADGSGNYALHPVGAGRGEPAAKNRRHELSALDRLSLRDISLHYSDEASGASYDLVIAEARGRAKADENLEFELTGELLGQPCTVEITGGSLNSLLGAEEPWPLAGGRVRLADITLDLTGSLNRDGPDQTGYLALRLDGTSLKRFSSILDRPLPEVTNYSVSLNIGIVPAQIQLTGITIDARELEQPVTGELVVSLHGRRPLVAGNVMVPELDLRRFMSAAKPQVPHGSTAASPANAGRQRLPWQLLQAADGDVHLRGGLIHAGALQLTDLRATVSLVDGDLVLPASASVLELPLSGRIEVDAGGPEPTVAVDLETPGARLDPLLGALTREKPLQGSLGSLSVTAGSSGETPAALLESLDLDLNLGPTELRRADSRLVEFSSVSLRHRHKQSFSMSARGELLHSPLRLRTEISAAATPAFLLDLDACDSHLLLTADRPEDPADGRTFSLEASGKRVCGLMTSAEQLFGADAAFEVAVGGILAEDLFQADVTTFTLGELGLRGRFEVAADAAGRPFVTGALRSSKIDLPALRRAGARNDEAFEARGDGRETGTAAPLVATLKSILAWKVLPVHEYLKTDGKLDLLVEQLDTGPILMTDVKLSALVKEGRLRPSPFQARIGSNLFTGSGAVDTTGPVPVVDLDLAADDFELAELLKELGIAHPPEVTIDRAAISMNFTGTNIRDMLLRSGAEVKMRGGSWLVAREGPSDLSVTVDAFDYARHPGTPATMSLTGNLNALPLTVRASSDGLLEERVGEPIILSAEGSCGDAHLRVDGRINRVPRNGTTLQLDTELSGNRLDSLDEILGYRLPPLGPYRVGGSLVGAATQLGLHDMFVQIGDTLLTGRLDLSGRSEEAGADGPLLEMRSTLTAETVQLDDFRFQDWSPLPGKRADSLPPSGQSSHAPENGKLQSLLSRELAEKLNGSFELDVREVLSGSDKLGSGRLEATIDGGRYTLDRLQLAIPGGAIRMEGAYRPGRDAVDARFRINAKGFDYGILARRVRPDSTLAGDVNLDLDLNSHAADPTALGRHLSGRLRFGVRPSEYEAGVIDLWAANIILEALPALLKGEPSVVNCLAGNFELEDGLMTPDVFLLDTTKIRVEGAGSVNFGTNTIDFLLRPTPKSAQFFSLATPVSITGPLARPTISVASSAILKTVFRQVTSIVTVPLQWLFGSRLEADGASACSAAMEWVLAGEAGRP